MVWHNHDSQTARADQLACIVPKLNRPHVQPPALVDQLRLAMHPAFRHAAQVIRIDLNPHSTPATLRDERVRPDRPQGFGEHNARPAVQQAVRLVGPSIHWHPAGHPVCADFQHLDAQGICDCGAAS